MITSGHQQQQAHEKLVFLEALIIGTETGAAGDDDFRDIQLAGLRSLAGDLRAEIADYERRSVQG